MTCKASVIWITLEFTHVDLLMLWLTVVPGHRGYVYTIFCRGNLGDRGVGNDGRSDWGR